MYRLLEIGEDMIDGDEYHYDIKATAGKWVRVDKDEIGEKMTAYTLPTRRKITSYTDE